MSNMADPLSVHYSLRVSAEQLERWKESASATGRTLPQLLRDGADAEVEYSEQAAALRRRMNERRGRP
jgi:predicted DNA-binding protein